MAVIASTSQGHEYRFADMESKEDISGTLMPQEVRLPKRIRIDPYGF